MGRHLRALVLEANEPEGGGIPAELQRAGFSVQIQRIESLDVLGVVLVRGAFDVVFSEHLLPGFDARRALAVARAKDHEVPFIAVSSTRGEELAVELVLAGADDFVLRSELARLGPAVDRALRKRTERSERIKAETFMLVTDRLSSIGVLASGVSHELNNPLAALIANLEMLAQDLHGIASIGLDPTIDPIGPAAAAAGELTTAATEQRRGERFSHLYPELADVLRDSREAADRLRSIVRDLRIFTRTDREETRPASVERVLESASRMAQSEVRHRARLSRSYSNVPPVDAGEARLGQVFLSLLINAAQAFGDTPAERNEIVLTTRIARRGIVAVEVRDNGRGIGPDVLPHLFEPFFTSKEPGVGTGLGLTIAHRIVASVGGEIEVESELGKGTTFRVLLPIAGDQTATVRRMSSGASSGAKRRRLLIVDDDEPVANSLRRLLSKSHDVTIANSAKSALELIEAGGVFDVILSDLLMPDMNGMDFYEALSRQRPDLAHRIIFVSGGAVSQRAISFLANVSNPRIDKPVDIRELLVLIDRLSGLG